MNQRLVRDPVYKQLSMLIKDDLRDGHYKVGDRFLSEREIGEKYQVNRATANKALYCLIAEQILEYRKGLGTFVRTLGLDYDLRRLVSFTSKTIAVGKTPSNRILEFNTVTAGELPAAAASALRPGTDDVFYFVRRLRLADDVPMILENRWLPTALCPDLEEADFLRSIYSLLADTSGLQIGGAEDCIYATLLRRPDSDLLGVQPSEPGFLVHSLGYLQDRRPLWWEESLYRGDLNGFRTTVGPDMSATPAHAFFRDASRSSSSSPAE